MAGAVTHFEILLPKEATKWFADVLYPRCTKAPAFTRWTPVTMVDRT